MSRTIDLTEVEPLPHLYWPLFQCITPECLAALDDYQRRRHRRHLQVMTKPADIIAFDGSKEVSRVPESENHMKVTG